MGDWDSDLLTWVKTEGKGVLEQQGGSEFSSENVRLRYLLNIEVEMLSRQLYI